MDSFDDLNDQSLSFPQDQANAVGDIQSDNNQNAQPTIYETDYYN